MNAWLLKLAAAILATSCAEMLLPSGKIKSACRTVLALVCVAVVIEPLAIVADYEFDFSDIFGQTAAVDGGYVDETNEYYCSVMEKEIINFLETKGVEALGCEVEGKIGNGKFEIEKVSVKIKNSVITGEDEHIIGIVKITTMLSEALGTDRVYVYGE